MSEAPKAPRRVVTQAERVAAAFGGPARLARLSGITESTVYRWSYPRTRGGTGGRIPSNSLDRVLECADMHGVELTAAMLSPLPSPAPAQAGGRP